MTSDLPSPSAGDGGSPVRTPTGAKVVRILGIVALVVTAALAVPYIATRWFVVVPFFLLAFAGASTGLVLSSRGPRLAGRRIGAWSLAAVLVAIVIDIVLLVVFMVGITGPHLARVEMRGQGPVNMSATYTTAEGSDIVTSPAQAEATATTAGSSAELTLTAPAGSETARVSCQIFWNGEKVIEETGTGTVTCRYQRR